MDEDRKAAGLEPLPRVPWFLTDLSVDSPKKTHDADRSTAGHRGELLRECWIATKKVFFAALLMDVIYQLIVIRWIYLGGALIVAPVLAFIPCGLIRGPVSRLMGHKRAGQSGNRGR